VEVPFVAFVDEAGASRTGALYLQRSEVFLAKSISQYLPEDNLISVACRRPDDAQGIVQGCLPGSLRLKWRPAQLLRKLACAGYLGRVESYKAQENCSTTVDMVNSEINELLNEAVEVRGA
jgi:hypothetical protein